MRRFDELDPGVAIRRHAHAAPYAAVVLEGGYEEAGDGGRFRVQAGDVLIHGAFSAHLDRAPGRRTRVLNLPLPLLRSPRSTVWRVLDPDALARLAERDEVEAVARLLEMLEPGEPAQRDEIDHLAAVLSERDAPALTDWSMASRMSRETVWRRFRSTYGVAPARYRVEARTRRAWRRLVAGTAGLADIALAEGFADQAHLSRDVRALTGRSPGQWRSLQHSFKTLTA